ncbi:acyl-ACP--UDP-N-acetylglucosamine O-acyltransferase [Aminobacter anthyllidis]|uniref:Acyl-[acyl-carrier-protein]--UDP-N-acetylglucosamine O-acyltransferase n=1 Tax=Aminobacter anthyllidis TaxID=1035067 RepID=A0A9X1A805_9HYPH|nr:acyl-ACP--UDP-N-acetylglucosamine O-acyltransferase [Aminobacter anthyllidis]MBT1154843.1 acyl-ACP--UDP-N-acetylglucosamine O-acyltransferase [Aminobacter anthyllidis]
MQTETFIHPAAVVEAGAQLGAGVRVGPFCHVSADAIIGDRVELMSHVSILGATSLGEGCKVFPQATLGAAPQNNKHKGGRTTLVVGKNSTIREGVTMHVGTDTSRGTTTVGDNGLFLAYAHIAHDCIVGDNVTMANVATLGGHVEVGNNVTLGGLCAVHQMTRIGHHAFAGGGAIVDGDVIPYGMVMGNRARLRGLNVIGMRRSGLPRAEIFALRKAYKMIFDPTRSVAESILLVEGEFAGSPIVRDVLDFIQARGKRHFTVPPLRNAVAEDAADDEG